MQKTKEGVSYEGPSEASSGGLGGNPRERSISTAGSGPLDLLLYSSQHLDTALAVTLVCRAVQVTARRAKRENGGEDPPGSTMTC
jgi:hypothetical protein